jgi:hypothetical protein
MLDAPTCSDEAIATFDCVYRLPERTVAGQRLNQSPAPLPKVGDSTLSALLRRADRPHTVLTTTTTNVELSTYGNEFGIRCRRRRKHKPLVVSDSFKKENSPLPRITGLWKKTGPAIGCVMGDYLVRWDVNGGKEDGHHDVKADVAGRFCGNGNGAKGDGESSSQDTADESAATKRRLAVRRRRIDATKSGVEEDGVRNGRPLKLNVDVARLRRRGPVESCGEMRSAGTASTASKTSEGSTKSLLLPAAAKCFISPKISPICLRRASNDGDIYGQVEGYSTTTVAAVGSELCPVSREQAVRGSEVVQSALESSGRMMLRLCGFDIEEEHHKMEKVILNDTVSDDDESSTVSRDESV